MCVKQHVARKEVFAPEKLPIYWKGKTHRHIHQAVLDVWGHQLWIKQSSWNHPNAFQGEKNNTVVACVINSRSSAFLLVSNNFAHASLCCVAWNIPEFLQIPSKVHFLVNSPLFNLWMPSPSKPRLQSISAKYNSVI